MAAKIVTRVTDGMHLVQAVEKTFVELKASHGTAGAVAISSVGTIHQFSSEPVMAFASYDGKTLDLF